MKKLINCFLLKVEKLHGCSSLASLTPFKGLIVHVIHHSLHFFVATLCHSREVFWSTQRRLGDRTVRIHLDRIVGIKPFTTGSLALDGVNSTTVGTTLTSNICA